MTNYLTVLVAGVVNMVLGFVWYSALFGKQWTKFQGWTKEEMEKKKKESNMGVMYGMMFVSALVLAYFMSWVVHLTGASDWMSGAMVGGMVWLGFVATTQFANWLFSGKKVGLYFIDTGYYLVSLVIFGVLFALWR